MPAVSKRGGYDTFYDVHLPPIYQKKKKVRFSDITPHDDTPGICSRFRPTRTTLTLAAVGIFAIVFGLVFTIDQRPSSKKHVAKDGPDSQGTTPVLVDGSTLRLRLLTRDEADPYGASCLDGSLPGFYFANNTDVNAANKWVVYFKGGGWCFNETECLKRSNTDLGSSNYFTDTYTLTGGPLATQYTHNPTFSSFNKALLYYCDGSSFTGDRSDPITFHGQQLYFRGRRNLDAMLDVLLGQYGLNNAEEVLVVGGSAGGLSTFIHTDYIRHKLPEGLRKFKSMALSGFFLMHNNSEGISTYPDSIKYMVNMHNSSSSLNEKCKEEAEPGTEWKCFSAKEAYSRIETPTYVVNSALDSWQLDNILQYPDSNCVGHKGSEKYSQFSGCTTDEINDLNEYASRFLIDLTHNSAGRFNRSGNGAYIESCLEHVAAEYGGWIVYETGQFNITMRDAVALWWSSDSEPASHHIYLPQLLSRDEPHQTNPTCAKTCNYCTTD